MPRICRERILILAPILLESPLMFEILQKIRDQYSIDKLEPNGGPHKQRLVTCPARRYAAPSSNADKRGWRVTAEAGFHCWKFNQTTGIWGAKG